MEDRPGRLVRSSFRASTSSGQKPTLVPSSSNADVVDFDRAARAPTLVALHVVAPPAGIAVGGSGQFYATAQYDDGSVADVTQQVAWTSSSSASLAIAAGGSASVLAAPAAPVTIQASLAGVTGVASGMFVPGVVSP